MNRLIVRGFGPVKDAELELKTLNLLIGEQSIGKSTIAKLIAIFTDNGSLALILSSGIKAWKTRLSLFDLDIFGDDSYYIQYDYSENGIKLHIKIAGNRVYSSLFVNDEKITNKKKRAEFLLSKRTSFYKDRFFDNLVDEMNSIKNEDVRYQVLSLQSLLESSLYVPAERIAFSIIDNLKSAFSLIGDATTFTYRRFMVSFDKARNRIKKYESQILGITYLNEEKGQFFIEPNSKKKYHLYNASSGIQSTIPLLVILDDIKNRGYLSVVIEEPETNLFPSTQVELLCEILQKARSEGRIVTITTHSPYILSAFNNYLYAGYVAKNKKKESESQLESIIPSSLWLNSDDCAVYSIGETINESRKYCISIIDKETGMIDSNTLDRISFSMSNEFEELEDIFIKNSR